MALVERRRGLYGLTHADQFLDGPASGSWVLFIDSEQGLGTAIIHLDADDSTEIYPSGSAQYNYWQTNVNDTGDFVLGPDLTNGEQRRLNLVLWFEGFLVPEIQDTLVVLNARVPPLNNTQKILGLTSALVSQSVPETQAENIASAFVTSGIKPKWNEIGMVDMPNRLKRFVDLLAKRSEAT